MLRMHRRHIFPQACMRVMRDTVCMYTGLYDRVVLVCLIHMLMYAMNNNMHVLH